MSKFIPALRPPGLPQGDYSYVPQVVLFGPHADINVLQDEINLWFRTMDATPDIRVDQAATQYQITGTGAALSHAAMITYVEIVNI